MSADRSKRLPWYRRLSFRLAVVMAAAMIIHDRFAMDAVDATARLFGLRVQDPVVVDFEGMPAAFVDTNVPEDLSAVAQSLVATPDEAAAEELAVLIAAWEPYACTDFVVTDPAMRITATYPGASIPIGGSAIQEFVSAEQLAYCPLESREGLVGWLCLWCDAGHVGEDGEALAVLSEAEYERESGVYESIFATARWVLPGLAALLLGWLVSWLVTRRLVRLSDSALRPYALGEEGFRVSGSDEIAGLGSALGSSRERIASLVDEMAASDVRRREFVAQMSHDIRTPLTALSACLERATQIAKGMPLDPGRDDLEDALSVAQQDSDRVSALAADLLEAARLDLPDALQEEDLLLGEVAERTLRELSLLGSREGVTLDLSAPDELPIVRGDGSRLLRVFENLVRNAIDHAASRVDVALRAVRGGVEVCITDDGDGFPMTDGAVDMTLARGMRADSAGLGLTVAERILAVHGAALVLENSAGGGARARFQLPGC